MTMLYAFFSVFSLLFPFFGLLVNSNNVRKYYIHFRNVIVIVLNGFFHFLQHFRFHSSRIDPSLVFRSFVFNMCILAKD